MTGVKVTGTTSKKEATRHIKSPGTSCRDSLHSSLNFEHSIAKGLPTYLSTSSSVLAEELKIT